MDGGAGSRAFGVGLAIVAVVAGWRFGFHPSIRLDADTVTVANPLRTVVVPLSRVGIATSAGYSGVTVEYLDGVKMRRVTAWAVQKMNVSQFFKRPTRADSVAAAIAAAAKASQAA